MIVNYLTTVTNPDCRHEHRWTERDMYATENEVIKLVQSFIYALHPNYVIETGTYKGDTAHAIGVALAHPWGNQTFRIEHPWESHLDTFEVDEERAEEARVNLEGLPVTVHNTSWSDFTPEQEIEFAWIDDHPDNRKAAFMHFHPFMADNCIVGFHDTGGAWAQIPPQIRELEDEGFIKTIWLPTPRGVVFAQVKKGPPQ